MNSKDEYKDTVVIFIDVLGTKKCDKFTENIQIHKIFHESVLHQNGINSSEYANDYEYNRKVFSFSDCAYIIYSFKDELESNKKDRVKLAYAALVNTSFVVTRILSSGRLLRGGMCFGLCYYDEFGCFGGAINDAFRIESKETFYPVIKIEDKLGKEVYEFAKSLPKQEVRNIVIKEQYGYILNPFYIFSCMSTFYYNKFTCKYDKFKTEITDSIAKMEAKEDDPKILAKIKYFKCLLNQFKPRFK